MRTRCRRVLCALLTAALLCTCGLAAFAVKEYMKNERWTSVTGSESTKMLENGDTFILMCYRETCGNCKYVGAKVVMDWMDTYGKNVYGVDVDDSDGTPAWVWTALDKTKATLPLVAFVHGGEVRAFSPDSDIETFAQMLDDAFFAFFTDVTKVNLSVLTPPDKTVYLTGEPLDTTGLTLLDVHADGSEETVTEGFACSGFSSDTPGHKTVTATYHGLETTFVVLVNTPDGKPAVWVEQPAKTKLRYGETTTLAADFCNLPEDVLLQWSYNVKTIRGIRIYEARDTGIDMTAEGFTQNVTVTLTAIRDDGSPILTQNGEAVTVQHTVRFRNNILFRLVALFNKLLGRGGCSSEV